MFVGDILNTAARLEEYAKRTTVDVVVSGALLQQLTLPPGIVATRCGELALRGKAGRVTAYSLSASAPETPGLAATAYKSYLLTEG